MKGSPVVIEGLQKAANAEASLATMYALYREDCKRFGLSIADGFDKSHEQSECFCSDLVARILFLDGDPVIEPAKAEAKSDVAAMLASATEAELAILDLYADLTRQFFEAGDMSNFHAAQHFSKWHTSGGNDNRGHLKWLQKQTWQLQNLGLQGYLTSKTI